MVGRRDFAPGLKRNKSSKTGNGNKPHTNGDLESGQLGGAKPRPTLFRFRDAANTALEDKRREDLKKKLLEGVNREQLEEFRKSDEEV